MLAITKKPRDIYYSFLCNLLTNPALNAVLFLAVFFGGAGLYTPLLAVLEISVVFIEALIYRTLAGWKIKKSLLISLILNGASLCVGLLLNYLL